MKTRGISDLFLPRKVAYHVKIILGSLLATIIFHLIRGWDDINPDSIWIFLLILIQLEIFIWLGYKFFNISSTLTAKEYLNKVIVRLFFFFILVMFISAIVLVLVFYSQSIIYGSDFSNVFSHLIRVETRGFFISYASGMLVGTIIFLYVQWIESLKREQKLREEKLIYRYETLKNQVRPHFLFNSLNTLSAMVQENEAADRFIQKLSSIYRYLLENADQDSVELEKEIGFVRDYFYLQQIRDEGKVVLSIGDFEIKGIRIIPISLQILVENALKHNAATRDHPLKIHISRVNHDYIVVRNNLRKKTVLESSSGIGLKNLSERILLSTGKELSIQENSAEFIVKIPLIIK